MISLVDQVRDITDSILVYFPTLRIERLAFFHLEKRVFLSEISPLPILSWTLWGL